VKPGDEVKEGQTLIKLDDVAAQADLRAKQATLKSAQIVLEERRRAFEQAEEASESGALPMRDYSERRTAVLLAEQDACVAQAALDGSKAQLDGCIVSAPITGVVSWLEVSPGMLARPGTVVWGEILDLSEIDVLCELTPEQAETITVGQMAEIQPTSRAGTGGKGRVISVGIATMDESVRIPVLVRLANPERQLRCGVAVKVSFSAGDLTHVKGQIA
jgi:RND family efflux transporter MFP subunit